MSVIAHPRWIEKAGGAAAVDRHFQLRGFDTVLVPGSRFLHIEAKSMRPMSGLDETLALFRPRPQQGNP